MCIKWVCQVRMLVKYVGQITLLRNIVFLNVEENFCWYPYLKKNCTNDSTYKF